jgi:hypothetical protein
VRGAHTLAALAWLAGLCLASAPTAAQMAELVRFEGTLTLRGEIGPDDGDRVLALLDDSVQRLAVDSLGGDFAATLDIADAVRARGLTVAVIGTCASSCAQFLLPAAARVTVADGGIVALHAAAHGAWREALRTGRLDAPAFAAARAVVAPLQARVDAHAAATGLQPRALEFLYALTSMRDVRVSLQPLNATQSVVQMDAARAPLCTGWLADGAALRALGLRHAPDWAMPDAREAALRLNVEPGTLYLGPPLPRAALAGVRSCADANRAARRHTAPR